MAAKQKPEKTKSIAGKASRGRESLSFDLLYQLSYMSVIASAGVPRDLIFQKSSRIPCSTADYFQKIESTCRNLKYDYATACRIVGEDAKDEPIKALLLRFSSSLVSGEPEADFLTREAAVQAEAYENEYNRKLETLKMWTDAYVSLILSAVLVIVMGIVSTMVWKTDTAFIVGLALTALATTFLGLYLIYLMSPREFVALRQPSSVEQRLINKYFKIAVAAALTLGVLPMLVSTQWGWSLVVMATAVMPLGIVATLDDRKISRRDMEVGPLLRSLGGVAGAMGTTVKEAVAQIDLKAINVLRHEVMTLYRRLHAGISTHISWRRFIEESGSELIKRSVGMFCDAIDLGGEPEKAGYHASLFAEKIALLRARRRTVAFPFHWLCLAMHGAIAALLTFVTEVMTIFGGMVASAQKSMPSISGSAAASSVFGFNFSGLVLMNRLVLPLLLALTLTNALAPTIAEGGSSYKLLFNLALTAAVTGISLAVLPSLAQAIFKSIQM
ncbi:MAG: archaellar assembly protein FlaJ [Chloroflexi bacterium]|nr:archaellar assembly protein FlaJ [Chloroflexota bacterium]